MRVLVSMAVLLSMVVSTVPVAYAASLTSLSLTLSSSVPDATGVKHTFDFATGSAGTIKGIRYEYCTAGSGSCTTPTGLDTTSAAIDAAGTDNEFDSFTVDASTNGTIDITDATGDSSNASPIVVFSGITNPSGSVVTIFYVRITTYDDTGLSSVIDGPSQTLSAVIPAITVSGVKDAILQLTVAGVTSGTEIGDATNGAKTTSDTSTATTIPFGTFAPDTDGTSGSDGASQAVAQDLTVVTNGLTGYTLTVDGDDTNGMSRSGGGANIAYVGADTAWDESHPDATGTTGIGVNAQGVGADGDANTGVFGTIASTDFDYESFASGVTLASASGPAAGSVDTRVSFRVQVAATQAAGDYSATITYTVLANF
jgi:hypothetical protein